MQTVLEQSDLNTGTLFDITPNPAPGPSPPLTAEVLDVKLQSLLQAITHNIAHKVGKLAKELRGEIDQLGKSTDSLEYKFDEMVQYVQVLEEDNATIKNTVTQLQAQQEDLENRELRHNLRFRGIPETVEDKDLCSYLLHLFNVVSPNPELNSKVPRSKFSAIFRLLL